MDGGFGDAVHVDELRGLITVALEPGFEAREVEASPPKMTRRRARVEEAEAAWSAWMSWRKAEGV